jgi:hypothetical protein
MTQRALMLMRFAINAPIVAPVSYRNAEIGDFPAKIVKKLIFTVLDQNSSVLELTNEFVEKAYFRTPAAHILKL